MSLYLSGTRVHLRKRGEFEQEKRIHHGERDAITDPLHLGLFLRKVNHFPTDIHSDQSFHRRILLCSFHEPIPGSTAHIQHPLKPAWVWLLWQYATHARS